MPEQPKNSARELYELMKEWRTTPAGHSTKSHRGGADWWTNHVRAVQLVQEVDEQIKQIQRDDPEGEAPFRSGALNSIKNAVFVTNQSMVDTAGSGRSHLDDDDMSALHLLAALWKAPAPANPGAAEDVLATARDIEDLVLGLEDLDAQSKEYLLSLIHNLQAAVVAVNVRGTVDVEHLTDQLAGALARLFPAAASEEKREKARWTLERLVANVKLMLGLVSPTVQAIDSAQSLFTNQKALPPGQ